MKDYKIKTLAENIFASDRSCIFSRVIEISANRFKVTQEAGNCFSRTRIYIMLPTRTWEVVADEDDIGECYINYVSGEATKKREMDRIYGRAVDYIIKVFL